MHICITKKLMKTNVQIKCMHPAATCMNLTSEFGSQPINNEITMHLKSPYFGAKALIIKLFFAMAFMTVFGQIAASTKSEVNEFNQREEIQSNVYSFTCFTNKSEIPFSPNQEKIGLQITTWPSHQLITRIFAIFLREVLNYRNVSLFPIVFNEESKGNPQFEEQQRLSSTMDLMNNRYALMMNMGLWTPSQGHSRKPSNVLQAGISMTSGRFGWYTSPTYMNSTKEYLHYSIFLNRSNSLYEQFVIEDEDMGVLLQVSSDNYTSPLCNKIKCATLLAEFKNDTSFVKFQIRDMKAFLNVLWLGPSFRSQINRLYSKYTTGLSDKRLLIVHWTPSDVIDGENVYEHIAMPQCEELKSLWYSDCKYELTAVIKYYAKGISKYKRLMFALQKFWIRNLELKKLFQDLNKERRYIKESTLPERIYDMLACKWLQSNTDTYKTWVLKERITLSVGGIFPIVENNRGHQNIVQAVRMAASAINESNEILNNYNFRVHTNDGECKADIVMRTFIHYFNDPEVVGILGPACSETVEPIAGISRHTNMAVISYSAEGASFLDRQAYPFFFRTIGSNRQYEDLYISLMKELGWKRVAALTEDGQKYTEYISHMESTLKNNNFELIANKKFLSDVSPVLMNKYLDDLKKRRARIIIADIQNKYAAIAMCEAYKLEMTAHQGYVWFLPSWLSSDFQSLLVEGNNSCSIEELEDAFEGHFSITHSPYGNNETIMEENISIKQWRESYSARVHDVSMYTAFAYDAVWVYAKAVDKILTENKNSVETFRSKSMMTRLVDAIWETDFDGLSGRVRFGQGGSRITDLVVNQWRKNQSIEVGKFIPKIIGTRRNLRTNGGHLIIRTKSITWLPDGTPPGDGTYDCSFSSLAEFLDMDCEKASLAFTTLICFIAMVVISLISFLFWKRRYDKKLKRSAKIMKNFGIDLLSPSHINTLDKWEVPKENVVVNRILGKGAFGKVYGGDALIGPEGWTAVAVKTLRTEASTEDRLDFLSEAQAMKLFNHKNIVKLLGVCLQSEPIYSIMEFMLYGDLKTFLLARRHMVNEKINDDSDITPKRLTMYAMDVARGLAYLAQQKYVHRDIACRNCLVSSQRVVKIGDFGMARPTYESDYYRFNRKGMLPVRWMAPEALVLGMFTPASDVWAFGVVLFEIITFGSLPYQGLTNNQVLEYVKAGNCLDVPAGAKPQLEGLLKSCWNKDTKKRPTASEIVKYIAKYPSILTPCLDFPIGSVEMTESESDQLELLPKPRHSLQQINDDACKSTTTDKISSVICDGKTNDPVCIEMDQNSNKSGNGAELYNTILPTTPDGYSIMSPLISHSINHVYQQTPF
ncbi:uncharacterized protein LOC106092877 isoform X2 [Stomoxys calcitrans]|uniref:uncharacterized protein LOC106092877 isoform X2 n=1 Tax=Stomoxys calcitrans TaxID=35570 RepID=UPI0027E38E66|nr:uncharacterized protein LOC106092877 isoform X2 [Stomoxys calcitrans]